MRVMHKGKLNRSVKNLKNTRVWIVRFEKELWVLKRGGELWRRVVGLGEG